MTINEIMYDPIGVDEGHEWIEIKNNGSNELVLTGASTVDNWKFNDGANHYIYFYPESDNDQSIIIKAGDFIILADNPATFLIDYPNHTGTIFKAAMSLNNSGDTVKLSNDDGNNWFAEATYLSTQGAAGDGKTLERDSTFGVRDSESWRVSFVNRGTPGVENSTVADLPQYSKDVYINEISAHPAGGAENEFIELYNNSNLDVDLSGWKLDDIRDGGSGEYSISSNTIISANSYFVFYKNQTKISLNDDGDFARLIWPDGREACSIPYPKLKKEAAYIRTNYGNWQISANQSPGQENKLVLLETIESPTDFPQNSLQDREAKVVTNKTKKAGDIKLSINQNNEKVAFAKENNLASTPIQAMLDEIVSNSDKTRGINTLHERRFNNIIVVTSIVCSLLLAGLILRWVWTKKY